MLPKLNVWLEKEGDVVLSQWRVKLLETIGETGSISSAAEKLGVPYRRAWEKVQEIEAGLRAIAQFHAFADGLDAEIERRYRKTFGA
jgi:molybdate transport system regulatory protein